MFVSIASCNYPAITGWLQDHLLPCPFKHFTGFDCPLCGFQRSILALLRGHFMESLRYYPAAIPIVLIFVCWIARSRMPVNVPGHYQKAFTTCTIFIVAVSYLFKVARYF